MARRTHRLAVCGLGRAGKDVAAACLAAHTPLRYAGSTSEAASDIVWDRWGRGRYESPEAMWEDRRGHRATWARIIWDHNRPDGLTLYREMAATTDILTGIRKAEELAACRAAGLVDLALWIDRPGAAEDSASCTLTAGDCDATIVNDRGLAEFEVKLRRLAAAMGLLDVG